MLETARHQGTELECPSGIRPAPGRRLYSIHSQYVSLGHNRFLQLHDTAIREVDWLDRSRRLAPHARCHQRLLASSFRYIPQGPALAPAGRIITAVSRSDFRSATALMDFLVVAALIQPSLDLFASLVERWLAF